MSYCKKKNGFTLVELLVYIGILAIVITSVVSTMFFVISTREKAKTINEIESQGALVMQLITQSIRNSEGVNSPEVGNNNNTISLSVSEQQDSPTVFDINNGVLRVKKGSQTEVDLTSSRVIASNLDFYNVSRTDTENIIKVEFQLEYNNQGPAFQFDYSKTFYGSASLRY
jgi:prepilin-type N-terminal cleavage/methylation domain-containing protein